MFDSRLTRDVLLVALTAAAGWTDALSYAALGHVFTANMTGNLVLLGLALARVEATTVERSAAALAGFAAGALAGSVIARRGPASAWPPRVTAALGVEAALLVAFAALWLAGGPPDGLIALAALGMGVQSSAVRRLDVPGVATTFVTGTITALMAGLAALRATGGPWRHAAVVAALVAGAGVGALLWSRWPEAAGLGPAGLVAAVALTAAWARPARTDRSHD
ncbi:MAG TPA: YoaK family protein [Candidatus Dormibacteraeota bacterium]|nr:YoaK family protein [Candidatus Dormibacteraeota bacterium]